MTNTIDTNINHGVTLSSGGSYQSPLTITSTGTVSNTAGDAVYAAGTYLNPTLVNYGRVIGTADGVDFKDGGSVANTGTGLIQGNNGVFISGAAGTVTNSATIAGTGGLASASSRAAASAIPAPP